MNRMRCKAAVSISYGGRTEDLVPGADYDLDRVLVPGDAHVADFTLADAVEGKGSEWFEPVLDDESEDNAGL